MPAVEFTPGVRGRRGGMFLRRWALLHPSITDEDLQIIRDAMIKEDIVQACLDIQKQLDGYAAQLSSRFTDGGWLSGRYVPSGESFEEFSCSGKFDGQALCRCATPMGAMGLFSSVIEQYIDGRTGRTLYWRSYPEIYVIPKWCVACKHNAGFAYDVYARLLIL